MPPPEWVRSFAPATAGLAQDDTYWSLLVAQAKGFYVTRGVALTGNRLVACLFVDFIFQALADSNRRKLLDRLHLNNGQTLKELCRGAVMSRQAVSKHLAILKRADLVIPLWRGREKLHYLNPMPLYQISERWISKYEEARLRALLDLKRALEENRPRNL